MIIKVCGIKTVENINDLAAMPIDMIGLNFYPPSVRYIPPDFPAVYFDRLPDHIQRVGVFVNEKKEVILQKASRYQLDYVQLHGDESPELCLTLSRELPIIKVFRVDDSFDFKTVESYECASFFLFDTKTQLYGGSGKKFEWDKLQDYSYPLPFLLSGGIGPNDAVQLQNLHHTQFAGIDINSKFEQIPGVKNVHAIRTFMEAMGV